MSRLSLRTRLALDFAVAMAAVLALVGASVYLTVRESLNEQIAENTRDVVDARGDRDETLDTLLVLFLVGGPVALAAATFAGWLLAGAALRPVEAMRRRAAEISADTTGERLPVPRSEDEIHRLATTLNEMLERLDAGLLRERRFVADASHELRTPLSLLRTELELALRRPRTPEEHEAALRSVAEEVDRLVRLAEGLLLLAHRGGGRDPAGAHPVRELLESVARRFGKPRRRRVDDTLGEVEADRLRLEAALGNLVENALRHGAPPIRLEADAGRGPRRLPRHRCRAGLPARLPRACLRALRPRGRGADGEGRRPRARDRRRRRPRPRRRGDRPEPSRRRCRGDDLDPGSVRAMSIDPRVDIGHVHLKVADIERALGFYVGVLGFDLQQRMGDQAAFISAGDYHHHIGLNTWESRGGSPPPRGSTGLYHTAIRYPDRVQLADALRRVVEAGIPLTGASDHGVSEALYLNDPDGNGVELYRDRPREEWPLDPDGGVAMVSIPLDVEALLAEAP